MEITKHPRFRYMPGMLTSTGYRIIGVYERQPAGSGVTAVRYAGYSGEVRTCRMESFAQEHGSLDLSDAGTQGCLQSMLFGDCAKEGATPEVSANGASVCDLHEKRYYQACPYGGANLGESLCAALLAVWGP